MQRQFVMSAPAHWPPEREWSRDISSNQVSSFIIDVIKPSGVRVFG